MAFSEQIITANDVVSRILKEKNYVLIEDDTEALARICLLDIYGVKRGWNYILNMQEFSQDEVINFYKQYLRSCGKHFLEVG